MSMEVPSFSVTLIEASEAGVPLIERGEYMYTANWLPQVGDTIAVSRRDGTNGTNPGEILGYVTRVDPTSEHPISVVRADDRTAPSVDDVLA